MIVIMPRVSDHRQRRQQICDGVRTAALAGGLRSVTVAAAAREAGVSVGLVQHYYASKDELLADALQQLLDGILERVDRATACAERRQARIEHMLGAGLEQLLPLDRTRTAEAYLRHSFAALALDEPALKAPVLAAAALMRGRVEKALTNAFTCGEIPDPAAVDVPVVARSLIAVTDGLASDLLLEPSELERANARTILADQLAAIFTGRCGRHS